MHRSLGWVSLLVIASLSSCGWFGGGDRAETYAGPDGYAGSIARNGPFVLDAVYMDDSTRGIEGVVRLTWWHVFSVTVQNRSAREVTVRPDQFSMIDVYGTMKRSLALEDVLAYRSHLMGPLMSYQRRAIRRAMWSGEPIAPGAFAVGYVFFARSGEQAPPWKLTFDPDSARAEDELVAAFPMLREAHAARLASGEISAPPGPEAVADPAAAEEVAVEPEAVADPVADVEAADSDIESGEEVAADVVQPDDAETAVLEDDAAIDSGETADSDAAVVSEDTGEAMTEAATPSTGSTDAATPDEGSPDQTGAGGEEQPDSDPPAADSEGDSTPAED